MYTIVLFIICPPNYYKVIKMNEFKTPQERANYAIRELEKEILEIEKTEEYERLQKNGREPIKLQEVRAAIKRIPSACNLWQEATEYGLVLLTKPEAEIIQDGNVLEIQGISFLAKELDSAFTLDAYMMDHYSRYLALLLRQAAPSQVRLYSGTVLFPDRFSCACDECDRRYFIAIKNDR